MPDGVLVDAEAAQIRPAEDAGVVEVVEPDADGVIADRLDLEDADLAASGDDGFFLAAVALDLGGRALDPEQFGGVGDRQAVVPDDLEFLLRLLMADLLRPVLRAQRVGRGRRCRSACDIDWLSYSSTDSGRASSASMIGMPSRIG